jgi:WD40 repeat protein
MGYNRAVEDNREQPVIPYVEGGRMSTTCVAVVGAEVAIATEAQVQLYRWGETRPHWSQPVKGGVRAVAFTPSAVYVATETVLHRFPRRPFEPSQRYDLPLRTGAPTRLWAREAQVGLLTERGGLWHATYPEMRWQLLELSEASLTSVSVWQRQAVVADTAGQVYRLELAPVRVVQRWEGGLGGVHDWAWHPEGRWVAAACADGLVKLWSPEAGKLVQAFASHRLPPLLIAVHPAGSQLVSYGMDGLLFIYDVVQGRARLDAPLRAPDGVAEALALRWASASRLWLLSGAGFYACALPEGRWQARRFQSERPQSN